MGTVVTRILYQNRIYSEQGQYCRGHNNMLSHNRGGKRRKEKIYKKNQSVNKKFKTQFKNIDELQTKDERINKKNKIDTKHVMIVNNVFFLQNTVPGIDGKWEYLKY